MAFFGLVFALYFSVGNEFCNMLNLLNINFEETINDAAVLYSICSTAEKKGSLDMKCAIKFRSFVSTVD